VKGLWERLCWLAAKVFPWPPLPIGGRVASGAASIAVLLGVLLSRLLLLPAGPWEQDEALMACGVVDFDPGRHMPLPPGFPLWVALGKLTRILGVGDPLQALQVASAVFSVLGLWALVGLWEGVIGRRLALAGAVFAAFIPGVWFHAARGFSETPSAVLAIIGLALWLRAGPAGLVPGVVAMTCAALVRPPLVPFFVLAVVLAVWGSRRDPRRVSRAVLAAVTVLAAVLIPTALAAGGWRFLVEVSANHVGEHLATLGTESWAPASLGFVRGLGTPWAAIVFTVLAALGWLGWRRALGGRWWAGSLAGAALGFLVVFMDNRNYPRYWILVWLLLATPAVAGVLLLVRSRVLAGAVAVAAAVAACAWAWPAVSYVHANRLPVVEAMGDVAAEGKGVLIFEDQLFSFRNLATVTGRLKVDSLRLTELQRASRGFGAAPAWLLAEGVGEDLPCAVSRVTELACPEPRVWRLSQERFLQVRLVRDPFLVGQGGSFLELDGTRRYIWCRASSALILPPAAGPGSVLLAVDVHQQLRDAPFEARAAGIQTLSGRLSPGPRILRIPVPPGVDPTIPLRIELETNREVSSPGDPRPIALRVFAALPVIPPTPPPPVVFFPEEGSIFAAFAEVEGTYPAELMGNPPVPAAWTGPRAVFTFPGGAGVVGVELLAPRPSPAAVEVRLGTLRVSLSVGPAPAGVEFTVPGELTDTGQLQLEITSSTFVPGGTDPRSLGVAVSRIWYLPRPLLLSVHN
jgi:hypothetical protein